MGDFGGLGEGDMRDIGDMGDMGDMGDTGDTGVAGLNLGSALSDTLTVIWGDSEEREESTDEISTTPVCPIYASAQPLTPAPAPPATRIFRSVLSAELTTRRLGGRFTRQQLQVSYFFAPSSLLCPLLSVLCALCSVLYSLFLLPSVLLPLPFASLPSWAPLTFLSLLSSRPSSSLGTRTSRQSPPCAPPWAPASHLPLGTLRHSYLLSGQSSTREKMCSKISHRSRGRVLGEVWDRSRSRE
ncbi:hypothetical protein B484DRAFT_148628 [Ochromonadaceae sp. CCMP2298]|nr:hypothetical protein B484DRAFT_148628 [Ochromonadaceae sp. CCMP2298]